MGGIVSVKKENKITKVTMHASSEQAVCKKCEQLFFFSITGLFSGILKKRISIATNKIGE